MSNSFSDIRQFGRLPVAIACAVPCNQHHGLKKRREHQLFISLTLDMCLLRILYWEKLLLAILHLAEKTFYQVNTFKVFDLSPRRRLPGRYL